MTSILNFGTSLPNYKKFIIAFILIPLKKIGYEPHFMKEVISLNLLFFFFCIDMSKKINNNFLNFVKKKKEREKETYQEKKKTILNFFFFNIEFQEWGKGKIKVILNFVFL
jgi:hypothetical protein